MPPRGPQDKKLARQNARSKEHDEERGHRPAIAKPNAAAIPNKTRRMKGK
jgi:hypothetical protein